MATLMDDGTVDLSPEEWAHEYHMMRLCAFSDLEDIVAGRPVNGDAANAQKPLAARIREAFDLFRSGWGENAGSRDITSDDALAINTIEREFMIAASDVEPALRAARMQKALTNLREFVATA